MMELDLGLLVLSLTLLTYPNRYTNYLSYTTLFSHLIFSFSLSFSFSSLTRLSKMTFTFLPQSVSNYFTSSSSSSLTAILICDRLHEDSSHVYCLLKSITHLHHRHGGCISKYPFNISEGSVGLSRSRITSESSRITYGMLNSHRCRRRSLWRLIAF